MNLSFKSKIYLYLFFSIAVNLTITIISICFFGIHYAVDDDLSMAYQAYGICFEPTSRILFSNVIIGWVEKTLFQIYPFLNWQLILYFGGLFFSGFLSLYLIAKYSPHLILLWYSFVLCFFYVTFINTTFTVVGAYICSHAFIALFIATKNQSIKFQLSSGLLILFGSLIRIESAYAIILFAIICWIAIVIKDFRDKKLFSSSLFQFSLPFLFIGILIILFHAGDLLAYSTNKDYSNYRIFNNLLQHVLDNRSIITLNDTESLSKLGLSQEVIDSLNSFYFNDTELLSYSFFYNIDSYGINSNLIHKGAFEDFIQVLFFTIRNSPYYYICLFTLLFLLIYSLHKYKLNGLFLSASLLFTTIPMFFELFWYCYIGRYIDFANKTIPERIIIVTAMGLWMSVIIIESCLITPQHKKDHAKQIIFIMVFVLTCSSQREYHYNAEGFKLKDESSIENEYSYLNDGRIYVADWKAQQIFMSEYSVWQNPKEDYLHNFILLGGCEVYHPNLLKRQSELGVYNPYKSLFENNNVYYLSPEEPIIPLNYLRAVYNPNITYVLIENQDKLNIYKFRISY